jgi:hypothetical protein
MSSTSDLITWSIAQLRGVGLNPYLSVAPQNTSTTTVAFPIVVLNVLSSNSNYSLNNGELRYERYNINVSIFDNQGNMDRSMVTLDNVQKCLEGKHDITIGNSIIMGTFLSSQNGPLWLNKEHYWALYSSWDVIISNKTLGKH